MASAALKATSATFAAMTSLQQGAHTLDDGNGGGGIFGAAGVGGAAAGRVSHPADAHMVAVLLYASEQVPVAMLDWTVAAILPHVDGARHIGLIAAVSGVALPLVQRAVESLVVCGCVTSRHNTSRHLLVAPMLRHLAFAAPPRAATQWCDHVVIVAPLHSASKS
jgi:hypothetical protein